MKSLVKWLLILGVIFGLLIFLANWKDQRDAKAAAAKQRQFEIEQLEAERRAAILAAPPEILPEGQRFSAPNVNRQAEQKFREIARQHNVEILEYRGLSANEVIVSMRTRNQVGMEDVIDQAIREDVINEFDDRRMSDTAQIVTDGTSGALIRSASTVLRIE